MKKIEGGITAVSGVRAAGVHAGIKAAEAKDVALIVTDIPAAARLAFSLRIALPLHRLSYAASISTLDAHKRLLSIAGTPTPVPVKSAWRMHNGWLPQQQNNSV